MENLQNNRNLAGYIILIFFIGMGAFVYFRDNTKEVNRQHSIEENVDKELSGEDENEFKEPENILAELTDNEKTIEAELIAVGESSGSGYGYLLFTNNMTLHAVVAELPEPPEGSVYEGWLVQPSPLKFFSTGVMEQTDEGVYILEYARAGDYPSYSRVVITEETEVDGVPEKHIIEGDFKI